ncbi:MAG TPA: GNAT family N-acetyltransferase [Herpetosiphonaceae bacterium]|nr:GNAT family N-acetyltransferase [Herpetosiphonaceae bacterium]
MPYDELPLVIEDGFSLIAEHGGKIWAAIMSSWAAPPAAWMRALVFHHSLRPAEALPPLLQALERLLERQRAASLYVMSDDRDALWLRPLLIRQGYAPELDVVGYEKRTMFIPSWGNDRITIRAATPEDVPQITLVDAAAFSAEWVKSEMTLGGVFPLAPCYLVAEQDGATIGYAFATLHHAGLVAHLVRIAVLPGLQRQAIGVRLLAEVVHWCRQRDVQILSLNTQATNATAQRLYEWFGFLRNGERQVVLAKALAAAPGQAGQD